MKRREVLTCARCNWTFNGVTYDWMEVDGFPVHCVVCKQEDAVAVSYGKWRRANKKLVEMRAAREAQKQRRKEKGKA